MAEQQVQLIRDLSRAYEQKNMPAVSNLFHPDYVHVTLPHSVNIPKQNKAEYLEQLKKAFNAWAEVEPSTVTAVANTAGKVVVHVTSSVTLTTGSVVAYESFIDFHIGEDQSGNKKIKYAEEFVDANYARSLAPFMAAKA